MRIIPLVTSVILGCMATGIVFLAFLANYIFSRPNVAQGIGVFFRVMQQPSFLLCAVISFACVLYVVLH